MADTFTTNLVLTKPEIGASADTWGNKLNANFDTIAAIYSSGPALKVANGGTGATTAANARANLGLGDLATQNSNAVSITGGTAAFSSLTCSAVNANLLLQETDGGTNQRNWRLLGDNNSFYIQTLDDALTSGSNAITVSRSGTTVTSIALAATSVTINGGLAYHSGNIAAASIQESQIADGSIFPRVGSTETVTGQWNFTTVPNKTSGGKFLHYASASYSGGAVTVSTADPSGVPNNGDLWIKYVA